MENSWSGGVSEFHGFGRRLRIENALSPDSRNSRSRVRALFSVGGTRRAASSAASSGATISSEHGPQAPTVPPLLAAGLSQRDNRHHNEAYSEMALTLTVSGRNEFRGPA